MYTRNEKIVPIAIEQEMKDSYISYAMSVIVGRALPDARDGLKPVQRRILYTMRELSLDPGKPYKKSARIVGDTLGRFHPHGDMAVYDALVRMAQDFSVRYPLVDGQGNFGCFTGDTKIKLLDGRDRSFEELAQEFGSNKNFYVYSLDGEGRITVGIARNPRVTRRQATLIELSLDSGEKIRCTPDHRFMLRDSSYKQAKDLTDQDSLMPGYFKIAPVKEGLNDYLAVQQPSAVQYEFVHRMVDRWMEAKGLARRMRGPFIRHHKNLDRFDNQPENLERMVLQREGIQRYYRAKMNEALRGIEKRPLWNSSKRGSIIQAAAYNHRVVAKRPLGEQQDVWDITVEEHHNFILSAGVFVHNSVDGDNAAHMRYTEARLAPVAETMLNDIDKETVDFAPNFDESLTEPRVLPAALPNLLVNGSSGIAVGMATNIPPHNLNELAEGIIAMIDNPQIEVKELVRQIKGPDFPTGGLITGRQGILDAYTTGRGLIKVRAKAHIEEARGGKESIIVTEIPYQVNKATLLESIAALVREKKLEGIADLRDESDREGLRIVIDLKRDANGQILLNQLFKRTQLETTFGVILLALIENRPRICALKQLIQVYLDHRKEVVFRRTRFDLKRAQERAHILEGLKVALAHLDPIIKLIRRSKSEEEAKSALIKEYKLTASQAQAILEMQLKRLTALERSKLEQEYLELIKKISELQAILASETRVFGLIKEELREIAKRFGDERRTQIVAQIQELDVEDLIAEEDVVITISHSGYIKRLPVSGYRKQGRGGKGMTGAELKEEDFIEHLFVASTHDYLLCFTDKGRVYWLKVYDIPQASRQAKGKAIINLVEVSPGEQMAAFVPVREFKEDQSLIMATAQGLIKKTALSEYSHPRRGGIIGIGLEPGDRLIRVARSDGHQELLLATTLGKAIRFPESQVRDMGRGAKGVKGITLNKKDEVVGMAFCLKGTTALTVTANGFGKRTPVEAYRVQSRGGKGIINLKVTKKNGQALTLLTVVDQDEVMLITQKGQLIRCPVKGIRTTGRAAQGVRLMRLDSKDTLASVATVVPEEESNGVSAANSKEG